MQKCDCCNYAKSDISQVAFKSNLVLACNSAAKPSFFEEKIAITHAKKKKQSRRLPQLCRTRQCQQWQQQQLPYIV